MDKMLPLAICLTAIFAIALVLRTLLILMPDFSFPITTTPDYYNLPTVTPTIFDQNAPDPQLCPGYKAINVKKSENGVTADLTIAGRACNVYGNDITDLLLTVTYQTKDRLNVNIQPKYIGPANASWFKLDDEFVKLPTWDEQTKQSTSDLVFTWSNEPSFQFNVSRRQSGEVLFSTFGHVIVYEDQFVQLVTDMVDDYNVYGLAENIHGLRLGTNYTQTLFNVDAPNPVDGNGYGTHPFYQETRYNDGGPSTAHGVYARNAHAQEWLLREKTLTYRAIGGSLDFYFLSGRDSEHTEQSSDSSTALEVFRQYQIGCVGLPAMQQYWTLGFHQCHWGWKSINELREVIADYSNAGIPLESIWNDIDVYDRYRPFTNNPIGYPADDMHEFVGFLHSRGQHYVAIQDSNIYFPDPSNASDLASYPTFIHGAELGIFIRDPSTGYFYIGENWPGYGVWLDWLHASAQDFWSAQLIRFYESVPFDALWPDLNEVSSGCSYSCGNVLLNGSEIAASRVVSEAASRDTRNLDSPPYKINHAKPSKQIIEETIALSARHDDQYATAEYDVHSLWSIGMQKATYNAMKTIMPGKRPFMVSRSTFAGSGRYSGHWGGDNEAKWGAMYLSISQALTFQMSGVPMFGADTCGFAGDSSEELCARWMELSAFFPFYRNHYADGKHPQEAYVWPGVAEASRRAIGIRYSLLAYMYTLLYYAHTRGDTMMRALAWEFPNDKSLRAVDNQFMLGPSILVTPVLEPDARTVKGMLPGCGESTRWYDWYTLQEVKEVQPQANMTMDAPLEHINLHIRGGSILALQQPGNTTAATRLGTYSLVIAPDEHGLATGTIYLDDGESIDPSETTIVNVSEFSNYIRSF